MKTLIYNIIKPLKLRKYKSMIPSEVFKDIYQKNKWGDQESVSGPGSNLENTRHIRVELEFLIKKFDIKSILDIGCGDFNWMKKVNLEGINCCGVDVVPELIWENRRKYHDVSFICADITDVGFLETNLTGYELVICRDVFNHLSFELIYKALRNIEASGAKYLLLTDFPSIKTNKNIVTGDWRRLNFSYEPFHLFSMTEPEYCFNEGEIGKTMKMWDVKKLFA